MTILPLPSQVLGPENAIWDDGEWISWHEINEHIEREEMREKYPRGDLTIVPIFESLLTAAENYHRLTGRHLQVYGDIGELFASLTLGITLHRNFAKGSDGRLGNDFIEVKTITPLNKKHKITINLNGHFSKVFVVKIDQDFHISGNLIDRKTLPRGRKSVCISWDDLESPRARCNEA